MSEVKKQYGDMIPYRKNLNKITGGVTATILLEQIKYWYISNKNEPFYKFIEPCYNPLYKNGDSWIEELGFTKKEFVNAFKKLEKVGVVSKQINMMRVTYYELHLGVLDKLLKGFCIDDKRELMQVPKGNLDYSKNSNLTENTTETTTESKKNKQKNSEMENDQDLNFKLLLNDLSLKVERKSLVKYTSKTKELFEKNSDSWETIRDNYLLHQKREKKYSKKLENFLLDYDACLSDLVAKPKNESNNYPQKITTQSTNDLIDQMFPKDNQNNFIEMVADYE